MLLSREVAEQGLVCARQQSINGFVGRVGNVAEVRSGDQVEEGLLEAGDPTLSEFGSVTLNVESSDIPADEEDECIPIGELKGAAVALHSNDCDVDRTWHGSVHSCGADAHQSAVGSVAARSGDAEGDVFKCGEPVAAHSVVGYCCEQPGSQAVQRPAPFETCELCARVAVDILGVGGSENTTLAEFLGRHSRSDTGHHCHLRTFKEYVRASLARKQACP
ncbi:MAG: hypothetical protein ABS81_04295 [Pseudonocardia sp. SCN 72-86]|nr:MAG: hypothetical protein ABS81_04295 [Pseudonocardia sp. SCN 72-86]